MNDLNVTYILLYLKSIIIIFINNLNVTSEELGITCNWSSLICLLPNYLWSEIRVLYTINIIFFFKIISFWSDFRTNKGLEKMNL